MSNEDTKRPTGFLIFLVLAIPILYVFLLGPAVLLYHALPPGAGQEFIETVYSPLEWLDQKIPGQPLEKYVQWWGSLADAVL